MANLLDLSPDEFMFTLQEFGYSPERRDELIRQYREHNSVFGALNRAAQERQAEIAGEGRRPVAGGFLSKPEGSLGMDAVRGLRVEPMAGLLGMLTGAGRAVEAPAAAYQGLIPMGDVPLEALGTAGMASLGGAAMTRPAGSLGMGGRVASDSLPEPRNAAERMARDILDMRAAGRAGEVTDEMMAQADPQYMFANTPLPMDEASRMARAREFGDTGYHGTVEDYTNLRPSIQGKLGPGIYTAPEANYANSFAGKVYGEEEYLEGGNIMPLVMRSNPAPDIFRSEAGSMRRSVDDPFAGADLFTKYLDDLGFTGVKVNSEQTTLNPRNVRSRFARFDPEFSHLANLNAANIDPLAGLFGALAAEEQRRQRNSR